MDLIKIGRKGQVTIPKGILRAIGVEDEAPMSIEATRDGAIVLRPVAVYPIELYSDERIAEFERANAAPPEVLAKVDALIAKRRR